MNNDYLISNILKFVPTSDLEQTKLVNKQWNDISQTDARDFRLESEGYFYIDTDKFDIHIYRRANGELIQASVCDINNNEFTFEIINECIYLNYEHFDGSGHRDLFTSEWVKLLPYHVHLFWDFLSKQIEINTLVIERINNYGPYDD